MPKKTPDSPPATTEAGKSPEKPIDFAFIRSRMIQGVEKLMKDSGSNTTDKIVDGAQLNSFFSNITNAAVKRGFAFTSEEENNEALKLKEELETLTGRKLQNSLYMSFLASMMYLGDKKGEDLLLIGSQFNDIRFWYPFLNRKEVVERVSFDSMSNDEIAQLGHKMFAEYVKGMTKDEAGYQKEHTFLSGHESHHIWYPLREYFKFDGMQPEELIAFGEKYANPYIWERALEKIGREYIQGLDAENRGQLRERILRTTPGFYGNMPHYMQQYFSA